MTIWLNRAGPHGEYEQKFISENRIYATWNNLSSELSKFKSKQSLFKELSNIYSGSKPKSVGSWTTQLWYFSHEMNIGDLVILPLKTQPAINIGRITGDYNFNPQANNPFYHSRSVEWIGEAIPRTHFGQDLLNTFGAFLTICRVKNNNAEPRIINMMKNDWKPEQVKSVIKASESHEDDTSEYESTDLEDTSRDQITRLINARFKNHELTELVEAILKAQGYTTFRSSEGPDGGADILAGGPPHGFGSPKLCVEVKSQDSPIDRPTIDKLLGAVSKFGADEGLFVAWGGFKPNVYRELAPQFFGLRLWSRDDLLTQLFANYHKLDEDIKAKLPLKQIWTVANPEDIDED